MSRKITSVAYLNCFVFEKTIGCYDKDDSLRMDLIQGLGIESTRYLNSKELNIRVWILK